MRDTRPTRPTRPAAKPSLNAVQAAYLHSLLGKAITARLLDGKVLTGTLAAYDQFTVRLDRDGVSLLVYKQGIAYLAPASTREGGTQ